MKKFYFEGDPFTYFLTTKYGDFGLLKRSEVKDLLLYYKISNQNQNKSEINHAIISSSQSIGFEKKTDKKYLGHIKINYDKPFDYTFEKNQENIASSLLFELDAECNIERKKTIDEWREKYEKNKNIQFTENEYCRFKTNYYKYQLPLLKRVEPCNHELCDNCIGYGVIPIYFGLNQNTGICIKCKGKGILNYNDIPKNIHRWQPDEVLSFGKNKGLKLSEIFQYQPTYIEWLILNSNDFYIDIELFELLPESTTLEIGIVSGSTAYKNIINDVKNLRISQLIINSSHNRLDHMNDKLNVIQIKEMLEIAPNWIKRIKYKFSKEAIDKNNLKFSL